jgi:hypothetical protein
MALDIHARVQDADDIYALVHDEIKDQVLAAAREFHWLIAGLGVVAILYGALMALSQTNLQRMLAFSSLSHVGLVLLGIASFNIQGIQDALFQLLNFSIVAGWIFLLAGFLHHRTGSTDIISLGGVANSMPLLAAFFLLFGLAGMGVPGTSGFPAESLMILSALDTHTGAGLRTDPVSHTGELKPGDEGRVSPLILNGQHIRYFFRRTENAREQVSLPAPLFNRCLLLLNHSSTTHVFVPVRSMQFQAVIDADEIIFVDNHAYAVENGHGGRLIVLAWEVALHRPRDSVSEPVPIEVVYYGAERHETHRRLMSEFPKTLDTWEARLREGQTENRTAAILPFAPQQ